MDSSTARHANEKKKLKRQLSQWKDDFERQNGRKHNSDGSDFDEAYLSMRRQYLYYQERAKSEKKKDGVGDLSPPVKKMSQVRPESSIVEALPISVLPPGGPSSESHAGVANRKRRGSLAQTSPPGINRTSSNHRKSALGWTKTHVSSSDIVKVVREEFDILGPVMVRRELQKLASCGAITINESILSESMPEPFVSTPTALEVRSPKQVLEGNIESLTCYENSKNHESEDSDEDWTLEQNCEYGQRVAERLGLPEFQEALEMHSDILHHSITEKINEWEKEKKGTISQDVREFPDHFILHHRLYHQEMAYGGSIRDIMDVYWALAIHDGKFDDVVLDSKSSSVEKLDIEDAQEDLDSEVISFLENKSQMIAWFKVTMIAITQCALPFIILYETMVEHNAVPKSYTLEDYPWEVWCRSSIRGDHGEEEQLDDLTNAQHSLIVWIKRSVLFIFMTYLAIYGYYSWQSFVSGMYFMAPKYAYFRTTHQGWTQIGLLANTVATLSIVLLTAVILFFTEGLIDMILNALALIFLRELDNGLVSGEEEDLYVRRYRMWMAVAYENWTIDPRQFPRKYRALFRRKNSHVAVKGFDKALHGKVFQFVTLAIIMSNFATPFWMLFCY